MTAVARQRIHGRDAMSLGNGVLKEDGRGQYNETQSRRQPDRVNADEAKQVDKRAEGRPAWQACSSG